MVMHFIRWTAILAAVLPTAAYSAGFARNANFVVYTPDEPSPSGEQRFAALVLERAEAFRKEFAAQWLGEELPQGEGRTAIHIDFSSTDDRGLTWAKDRPDRIFHNIYLTTSPENATGSTLHHELAHTVLATRFPHPNRLPPWLEEGIASRYDDEARRAAGEQLSRFWARTGRAPQLAHLLVMRDMKSFDESSYAAATSLVSFLLTLGDEQSLLRFAEDGQRHDWSRALQSHYRINDQRELQERWEAWLARNLGAG
jgi:hypothetical protein